MWLRRAEYGFAGLVICVGLIDMVWTLVAAAHNAL